MYPDFRDVKYVKKCFLELLKYCFTRTNSFNLDNLLRGFYKRRNCSTKQLHSLSKIKKPVKCQKSSQIWTVVDCSCSWQNHIHCFRDPARTLSSSGSRKQRTMAPIGIGFYLTSKLQYSHLLRLFYRRFEKRHIKFLAQSKWQQLFSLFNSKNTMVESSLSWGLFFLPPHFH